jgi:uncharacterized protein (DUF433 family)
VAISDVADDVKARLLKLSARQPDQIGKITKSRNILHRKPIIAGTRIPTEAIWDFAEAGYGVREIIREYPDLKPEDVKNAIAYERSRHEKKAVG